MLGATVVYAASSARREFQKIMQNKFGELLTVADTPKR
jgi:hypothetical protein